MPTSRPDEQLGCLVIQPVNPVSGLVMEAYSTFYSVLQVHLTSHQILPTWGQRIFKISLSLKRVKSDSNLFDFDSDKNLMDFGILLFTLVLLSC